jgi:hypothetical protein
LKRQFDAQQLAMNHQVSWFPVILLSCF